MTNTTDHGSGRDHPQKLEEWTVRIRELERHARASGAEADPESSGRLAELRAKRDEIRSMIEELGEAAERNRDALVDRVEAAYRALEEAFEEAKRRIGKGIERPGSR